MQKCNVRRVDKIVTDTMIVKIYNNALKMNTGWTSEDIGLIRIDII